MLQASRVVFVFEGQFEGNNDYNIYVPGFGSEGIFP